MKNILILLLSIISFAGYGQTTLNPLGSNTVSNINDANTKPTAVTGTDTYSATLPGTGYATGSAFFTYITDRVITFKFANAAGAGPWTLDVNGQGAKTLKKKNSSGTVVDIVSTDIPAANTIIPFRYNGTYFVLEGGGGGISSLTIGTTPITSGTTTRVLYDNAGSLGEYTVSGSGNVAMTTSPVFTTPNIGSATGSISGNAATVTTNANLTGDVTSVGNATAIASGVIVNADVNASAAIDGTKITPNFALPVNTQTGNYTFVLSDAGKIVRMNIVGTANTLTLPTNASVAYPVGTFLYYEQANTGITTLVAPSGGTATPPTGGSLVTGNQGVICSAYKTGTDTWEVNNGIPIGILAKNLGGTGVDNSLQTYTPTLTNTANLSASTARVLSFYRIGNIVTVAGYVTIDPTTTLTLTTLWISLPVVSNFTNVSQCGGSASANAVTDSSAGILADVSNDVAVLQYICTDVTNHDMRFTFSYEVL